MDAVESAYVGRMVAWMAAEGCVTIESGVPTTIERADGSRESGPRWRVAWDRRGAGKLYGLGHDLPGAILDLLGRLGDQAPAVPGSPSGGSIPGSHGPLGTSFGSKGGGATG